jgi:hypothetical protein
MPTDPEHYYEQTKRDLERIERSSEILRERFGGEVGECLSAIGRAAGRASRALGSSRPQLTMIEGGGGDAD